MNREFEAIFFDMDGTLINSEPHWLLAETELMAEYGHPWTKEDQQYCLGGPLPKIGKYMWELSGQSMSPEYFHQELVRRAIARIIAGTEFMPGASELLHEAISEGVLVGLVTASPAPMLEATLSKFPEKTFNVALSGDDVSVTKPSPECYFLAAKRLNVAIENCVILEDSLTGVAAAIASGAFVIAIPHLVKVEEGKRVRVLKSLEGVGLNQIEELYRQSQTMEVM